jgi:hypothetical protein
MSLMERLSRSSCFVCASSVQNHLQKQLSREGDAGPVQAAPCGKNQGLKLEAMPGAHLFVEGPFIDVRSCKRSFADEIVARKSEGAVDGGW